MAKLVVDTHNNLRAALGEDHDEPIPANMHHMVRNIIKPRIYLASKINFYYLFTQSDKKIELERFYT